MANSLSSMVDYLKFWGDIQASEGFADPGDLKRIVTESCTQHNPAYTCTDQSFTVPDAEVPAVNLLTLVFLCQVRATKMSKSPTMRTGDFQTTRDTPFEKTMKLMETYLDRYKQQCKLLGLDRFYGSSSIQTSEVTTESMETGAMTPYEMAELPPILNLNTPAQPVGSEVIISFSTTIFGQFSSRFIFHMTGNDPIFQPWNTASKVLSGINEAAALLLKTSNQRVSQCKVTQLDMTSGTVHRFLIVTSNKNGLYSYSNEVVVTITP